ncbi:MAG: ABC transporter ATP-binding protein [Nocardioides sp.]
MSSSERVLDVNNLVLRRGDVVVLNDVSLALGAGDTLAIQGPSGVGKSSLLGVLCGLLTPSEGRVQVCGLEISGAPDRVRSRMRGSKMGIVFQGDELIPELTIEENVTLPLRLGRGAAAEFRPRALALLDRLGVRELAGRLPTEVSGGQAQRAAVARAIIHQPRLVLADEPTGSLDEQASRTAMALLIELATEQDAAVIVVTHDDQIARACHRRVNLRDGTFNDPAGPAESEVG